LLWDGDRVIGVRVGDKGVDHNGNPKSNYEPGPDLLAKVVILAEGVRGTLAKQAIAKLHLDEGRDPHGVRRRRQGALAVQTGLGRRPARVIHTFGHPLPNDTFGGGFIYGMQNDVLDIGLVTGLDYSDPTTDPHDNFQKLQAASGDRREMIDGGKLLRYGAKAIPEGGFYAMPRPTPTGLLITGDSGGFLNGMRLKGIHLAIKSGMHGRRDRLRRARRREDDAEQLANFETASKSRGRTTNCERRATSIRASRAACSPA
jgi:electron-transferring-flavoprotein dehydrogenase